ncbi:MAG: hypothetical protein H0V36_00105 [Chloroflexi bacterium]|nr:hypothetical protein [Chloroflexota bacterium]
MTLRLTVKGVAPGVDSRERLRSLKPRGHRHVRAAATGVDSRASADPGAARSLRTAPNGPSPLRLKELLLANDESELRATSDEMLQVINRLRDIEMAKRAEPMGSHRFTELVQEATVLSRLVFRWGALQEEVSRIVQERIQRGEAPDRSIEQVEPRRLDRILAAWREAEFRFSSADVDYPARDQAVDDLERIREEYQEGHERLMGTVLAAKGPG